MPPLGYSSNLHPAETQAEIIAQVVPSANRVRELLGWGRLGLDLRLGLAALVGDPAPLRRALDAAHLSAHTLNGFPLLPFQAAVVKERAYLPDWSQPERLDASLRLLDAALLLSDEPLLTISTVPGSYLPLGAERNHPDRFAAALGHWAAAAARKRRDRGRTVVLCPEPEPWCLLEHSRQAAWFWRGPLATAGLEAACDALDGDRPAAAEALATHLGLCFDTCHISLACEDQAAAVARLVGAGVPIAKCQFSAAPEVRHPGRDPVGVAALRALAEPRFLHQTIAATDDGSCSRVPDLDQLGACLERLPHATTLRSHFHIPVFQEPSDRGLSSTLTESRAGLAACVAAGCTHIAVETYTWSILADQEPDRLAGTARELQTLARALEPTIHGTSP